MKHLTPEQEEEYNKAFEAIVNMFYATEKDNFSKCASFHIKPFNTDWDRKTVKEIMYHVKLYIGSWVIAPMERASGKHRIDVKKSLQYRHRKNLEYKRKFLKDLEKNREIIKIKPKKNKKK